MQLNFNTLLSKPRQHLEISILKEVASEVWNLTWSILDLGTEKPAAIVSSMKHREAQCNYTSQTEMVIDSSLTPNVAL